MKSKSKTIFSSIKRPLKNREGGDKNTLSNITRGSTIVLLKITTVFPFTLFPNTLVIDLHKINIIRKDFFLTDRRNSINHEDVLNIKIESGPLFATLKITTRFFSGKPIVISHLIKSEAILAKRLIHGLIVAHRKGVTLRNVEKEILLKKLEQLGSVE